MYLSEYGREEDGGSLGGGGGGKKRYIKFKKHI